MCPSVQQFPKRIHGAQIAADVAADIPVIIQIVLHFFQEGIALMPADDLQFRKRFRDSGKMDRAHVFRSEGMGVRRIVWRTLCDQSGMKENRHAEFLRPLIERIIFFVIVRLKLLVRLQTDESQVAETVDLIRRVAVEVNEPECEEKAVVASDRFQKFLLFREADIAEAAHAGKIHQPDLLEHAGFDNPVDPGCVVCQVSMRINEFHRMLRQILNFGAVAVLTSVTISRFLWFLACVTG